eukprot:TRINITY_DN5403_c0_g1_i2.p1 TRINITY_DN5403_c0_g1~~TRINITY_DN5403_c0_g1_i2.p1  ORF type:complete len:423 (+),score=69.28 TRINITY_DN5403_c0_g1_i2:109-1377(+)
MSFENVCATLEELYLQAAEIRDGNNADYIPELAAVNPELFAISVCSCTGEIWSIGDADIPFSFQSTIKPLLYNIAIQEVGDKAVHDHIGHEPSGQRFNSFTLDEDDKPHNPFNNAGAIMSSALIRSSIPSQVEAFKTIKGFAERASGLAAPVSFDNSVYLSELNTASRNYALTYFMQEKSEFMKTIPVERTLELYLSACALSINCKGLATIAATYASGGVCPITRDEVMDPIHAKASLQLMFNCGMYDYSGRFAFEIGIPAKSGVSGGLFMCVPGRFGIAIWSPPLDRHGNTVRGLWLAKKLVAAYPELHIFGSALRKAQVGSVMVGSDRACICSSVDCTIIQTVHSSEMSRQSLLAPPSFFPLKIASEMFFELCVESHGETDGAIDHSSSPAVDSRRFHRGSGAVQADCGRWRCGRQRLRL